MGINLNPGNKGFRTILNGTYVDKTGLVDYVSNTINTPRKLTCFSCPRRFGKSLRRRCFALISGHHLFISTVDDVRDIVRDIQRSVISELKDEFPQYVTGSERSLPRAMMSVSSNTDRKFIVIIEEWDAFFREAKNGEELQKEYVQLLCGLFKGGIATEETIAAAYMTGILPSRNMTRMPPPPSARYMTTAMLAT